MSGINETEEQVIARHKKETRDLIATVTGMKKQATKSKKKEVLKRCQQMEEDMKARHKEELLKVTSGGETATGADDDEEEENETDEDEFSPAKLLAQLEISKKEEEEEVNKRKVQTSAVPQALEGGKKKRNRQKERLAKREQEIKQMQEQAALEADDQPDLRAIELDNLAQLCNINKLKQFDIQPDGHCLFASIADQLKERCGIDATIQQLRTRAANHIREHPDTFAPFLFDEKTFTIRDVGDYTKELEETAMWGGDMEILALSNEFECPISIMMSGRAAMKINERFSTNPELKLVYYKHSYGLGEHYNSLRDDSDS